MVKGFEILTQGVRGFGMAIIFGAVIVVALSQFATQIPSTTAGNNLSLATINNGSNAISVAFGFSTAQMTILAIVVLISIVALIKFKSK